MEHNAVMQQYDKTWGCIIDKAVSRLLSAAAAQVRSPFRVYVISGGQSGTEAGILRIHRRPLPIIIPPTALHLLIILLSALSCLDFNSIVK
jgi:hypothetical protein